jgi:adenosylcobinamide-GDP ribazoletransferase
MTVQTKEEAAGTTNETDKRSFATRRAWLPAPMASFFAALQFLTIFPPVVRRPFTGIELGWSLTFFPVVGGLLGAMLLGLDRLLGLAFPPGVSAVLILAIWILATGAIHLDGFLDTCDGLWGGRNAEERLRIMRDERVGAFAVIGGILLLLIKYHALVALVDRETALLLAPILGRWGMVPAVVCFPYARAEGLGRDMKDNAGWLPLLLASACSIGAAWWLAAWLGILCAAVVLVALAGIAAIVLRRLPGFTGDIYGFCCEVAEVLVLLTLVAGAYA